MLSKYVKDKVYTDRQVSIGIPTLLLPSCVILVKIFDFSEP